CYHEYGHAMLEADGELAATYIDWVKSHATSRSENLGTGNVGRVSEGFEGNYPYLYMGREYPAKDARDFDGPHQTEVLPVALEHFRSARALAGHLVQDFQCYGRPETTALAVWALTKAPPADARSEGR
ncbi:MAG: hypothetical protein AAFQ82_22280, partial [Myxococcota bacterium]